MRTLLSCVDERYTNRTRLIEQQLFEDYFDGKGTSTADRGVRQWREDTDPDNGDNTFTFTACDGTTTTVTPSFAGTLYLGNFPAIVEWCAP
jgi:hypothetical protein